MSWKSEFKKTWKIILNFVSNMYLYLFVRIILNPTFTNHGILWAIEFFRILKSIKSLYVTDEKLFLVLKFCS